MVESRNSTNSAIESTFSISKNSNDKEETLSNDVNFRKFQIKPKEPLKTEIKEQRKWTAITKYQPIDTVTKYVDVPVKEIKYIKEPKIEIVEKIKEVPKYTTQYESKVIEVPEVHFVDKVICEPVITEKIKYVPKEIIQYNTIRKPITKNIVIEKKVNKLQVQERVRYESQEIVEEVYNHYDPMQDKYMNEDGNTICNDQVSENNVDSSLDRMYNFDNPRYQYIDDNNTLPPLLTPFGPQVKLPPNPVLEKVFIPKVDKVVELEKRIDIPIDFPVPYIVPKPKIIDVKVPVFKFNDKYVPVPIKSKIIPKITWTNQVYQVDCVIEKPYLVYHDIIKIVPTDAKITVNEYPKGIIKINPEELSEVDNLALWMRVNADLKKEKDEQQEKEMQDNINKGKRDISYSCICSETDSTERTSTLDEDPNASKETINSNNINNSNHKEDNIINTLPLHPGHPLNMIHLQNQWIHQETTQTQNMYQSKFLDAHKNAVFNLSTNYPREAELEAKQILALQEQANRNQNYKNINSYIN